MKYSQLCTLVQAPGSRCTVSSHRGQTTITGPSGSITIPSLGKAPADAAEKVYDATGVARQVLGLKARTH